MRERIHEIITVAERNDRASKIYDYSMIALILISIFPLAFKQEPPVFHMIETVAAAVFIVDYLLREATADLHLEKGIISFFIYPFTFLAIVEFIAILPTFFAVSNGLRMLKLFRLVRCFRAFRAFKMLRYSKSMRIILDVMHRQRTPLLAVCTLAAAYVLVSALIIFNIEPDTFPTYFDAVYWATVSLSTIGYGDIAPVTAAGKLVTILSSFVGIAIIALPSGIITAGYMEELNRAAASEQEEEKD